MQDTPNMLTRWAIELQSFDFTVKRENREGCMYDVRYGVPDMLSRNPIPKSYHAALRYPQFHYARHVKHAHTMGDSTAIIRLHGKTQKPGRLHVQLCLTRCRVTLSLSRVLQDTFEKGVDFMTSYKQCCHTRFGIACLSWSCSLGRTRRLPTNAAMIRCLSPAVDSSEWTLFRPGYPSYRSSLVLWCEAPDVGTLCLGTPLEPSQPSSLWAAAPGQFTCDHIKSDDVTTRPGTHNC